MLLCPQEEVQDAVGGDGAAGGPAGWGDRPYQTEARGEGPRQGVHTFLNNIANADYHSIKWLSPWLTQTLNIDSWQVRNMSLLTVLVLYKFYNNENFYYMLSGRL